MISQERTESDRHVVIEWPSVIKQKGTRIGEEFNPVLRALWTIDLITADELGVLTIGKHMSSFF